MIATTTRGNYKKKKKKKDEEKDDKRNTSCDYQLRHLSQTRRIRRRRFGVYCRPQVPMTISVVVALTTRIGSGCSFVVRHHGVGWRPARAIRQKQLHGRFSLFSSLSSSSSERCQEEREDLWNSHCKMQLAPMMDYTNRHFRYLVRLLSQRTLLYTEMVAANALAHEAPSLDKEEDDDWSYVRRVMLGQAAPLGNEGACVLQLGGSHPETLEKACRVVHRAQSKDVGICQYTALNLNCGCPSPRVAQKGCFGAALMEEEPPRVRELLLAMAQGSNGEMPLSVKCRIGTDLRNDQGTSSSAKTRSSSRHVQEYTEEDYQRLCRFIDTLSQDGLVTRFQIHARIAVLANHWSPADNRKIPPLRPHVVHRLTRDFPHLQFCLNGGIAHLAQARDILQQASNLQGVMIGRAWAAHPWSFSMTDAVLYHAPATLLPTHRWQVLQDYGKHADAEEALWGPRRVRRFLVKAIMPLFAGEPNSKAYRIALDELATRLKHNKEEEEDGAGPPLSELILQVAQTHLSERVLFQSPQDSWQEWLERQEEEGQKGDSKPGNAVLVQEWQNERKQQQQRQDESSTSREGGAAALAEKEDNMETNAPASITAM